MPNRKPGTRDPYQGRPIKVKKPKTAKKIVAPTFEDLKKRLGDAARAWNNALYALQAHDDFDFVDVYFDSANNEFTNVNVYRTCTDDTEVFDGGEDY